MILFCKILFCTLSLACFVSFAWAIKKHFRTTDENKMPAGMRLVSLLGLLFMILQLIAIFTMSEFNFWAAITGAFLYAASLAFFWWTIAATRQNRLTLAFSTDAPQHLLSAGPYEMVRHPFYTAYILFWSAGAVATLQWWLLPSVIVMTMLYIRAARLEETKFAAGNLSGDYSRYRERTGMFLPKTFSKSYSKLQTNK